ncbi:hypothetical protein BCR32DRAFT_279613 [Anaeromyces robustus]|uniref:CBM10 domain-containing protein n=1 Tax=Anaeromyces robustus TaxID=1754192 RepID=A0A1Y1X8D8_9FUNG|nr:hypothetical protein BCR32DRAFT_279613 [Anaeromyces robustus]|eukprot:ORX81614.1 hypothetical protein BCR32DRAFT_279613 [Anaeromyces robustus]
MLQNQKSKICINSENGNYFNTIDKTLPIYLLSSLRYVHSECDNIMYINITYSYILNHYKCEINSKHVKEIFEKYGFKVLNEYIVDSFPFLEKSQVHVCNTRILSKEEVLKIRNKYYISYYCKDDICVPSSYNYMGKTIEIPNKNGTLIKYITNTCRYEEIKTNNCNSNILCNNDFECLSNKCFNNYCVFNDETPIIHCDDIYSNILFRHSYMYRGKPYNDVCINDNECSSKQCTHETCDIQENGPSDNEGTGFKEELKINEIKIPGTHDIVFFKLWDTFSTTSIEDMATSINNNLLDYINKEKSIFHNEWFIMDFPSSDIIRDLGVYSDIDYYPIKSTNGNKRDENNNISKICLQRKFDSLGNNIVKTNYKCINYEDFTIKNGKKYCSKANPSKCLDGNYILRPSILEYARYNNLTCSSIFAKYGVKYCTNKNTKVEYIDNIEMFFTWDHNPTPSIVCFPEELGYPCCSDDPNAVVVTTDSDGQWGY